MKKRNVIFITGACFIILFVLLIVVSKYNSDQNAKIGMVAEESDTAAAPEISGTDEQNIVAAESESVDSEIASRMQSLQEVRDTIGDVIAEGKEGIYPHLTFTDFTPIVTTEDSVSTLTISYPLRYHDLDNKALAEKELEALQAIFPEGMDMNCVYDQCVGGETYEEMMARIEDGTYGTRVNEYSGELENGIPYLSYDEGVKGSVVHGQIDWGISYVWIRKDYKEVDHYVEKEYYAQAADGSLEDAYAVDNGSVTIREVIDTIEQFYNEEFPIPYESEERYRVSSVWVGALEDGTHVLCAGVGRTYHGVVFEYTHSGTFSYGLDERVDMFEAHLYPDGSIPFYINSFNDVIAEEDSFTEIISPEWALQSVSEQLAENSEYLVTGMELSYQETYYGKDPDNGADITTAVPVWKIMLSNQTDGRETFFYVNVVTGKITSRVCR